MESKSKKKLLILFFLIGAIVLGVAAGGIVALTHDLPQIISLESFNPSAVTRIYSSDKEILAELFVEKRDLVFLKDIPFFLKKAIVTTEDRNFYRHSGIDIKGILRAAAKDILAREFVEGASTITQQLAKTLFLTPKKTLVRKIKEAVLAFQLERRYTKDEILQMYLNQVYFGSGAYGVESAARIFFAKSVKDLSLSECALIAAMPKAPSRYSPLTNKDLALKRRNIVLKQMEDTGIITASDFNEAVKQELDLGKQKKQQAGTGYFVEYVKNFLEETIGSSRFYKDGLTVHTTLSLKLQNAANNAVANGMNALETRMKKNGIKEPYPQGALIALDVSTGGILAMTGGRDFDKSPFNRAVSAKRQPGSAFKPFVYAYAVNQGFTQNSMILDAPVVFKGAENKKDWMPENFSRKYMGEITLRKALTASKNIPAVRLMEMLGSDPVARFARKLGIETRLSADLSLALGTSETTLIDLTSAYAVFPNMGEKIIPFGVTEVLDRSGRVLWKVKPGKNIVMSRTAAAIITDMLSGVIKEGTGIKARVVDHPVAGKTGTTNQYKDALFVGFSPAIAAGVWVGRDEYKTLGNLETGARSALPIWIEFMTKALAGRPFQYFDIPDDVVKVSINPLTGRLATSDSKHAVTAVFKKGTEPLK